MSALTTDSSSSERILPTEEDFPLPSTRPTSAIEDRLMQKLLSRAYTNKDKSFDQMSYSISSVGTSIGQTTVSSRTSGNYLDSKVTGRSDDNSSLGSTEYSHSLDPSGNFGKDGSLNPEDKKFIRMYFQDLEEERSALMAQWREEFEQRNDGRKNRTIGEALQIVGDKMTACVLDPFWKFISYVEVFIANMPMTIAAVGLSWVTQGVIWFKFMGAFKELSNTGWAQVMP